MLSNIINLSTSYRRSSIFSPKLNSVYRKARQKVNLKTFYSKNLLKRTNELRTLRLKSGQQSFVYIIELIQPGKLINEKVRLKFCLI